jgi:medium-chain acyl-[acyl-carrier-protein] hydrolase
MTLANEASPGGDWISPRGRIDGARIRLFCLPHAGAGTAMYNTWRRFLPAFVELCPVQIPGREARLAEPSITDCARLIAEMTSALAVYMDRPYAIFGHSMGALLALDLARSLRSAGLPEPRCLFFSGRNATHVPMNHGSIHQMPDDEFLQALTTRYGGLPREILETPELLELYLPILRADLTLLETHRYEALAPLDCPVYALSGKEDSNVSDEGLDAWSEHTTGEFEAKRFDGGHFYLTGPGRTDLLEFLGDTLARLDAATPAQEREKAQETSNAE